LVLYLSALYPLKGPQILLKAIPEIIKTHKDAFFVFVGGGEVDEYKKLAEELGIQDWVRFTGYVEEKLKSLYYKASDIFVLPSIETFEVFPLVLLEAAASGLPMIVSDLNAFKCIIEDGYNGIVTRRGDPKALADAIIYLLENEDARKKMGENARRKVENYSWEKIAEMTEKVYEQVLSN
jgi:glycosyltransferase involved in cell wall biosynthesis